MLKVSIIIPVYNAQDSLTRCMDSVLKQEFTDFEVLAVDDGSPDRSGALLDSYSRKDARVRVLHQENRGVSAARNRALKEARGEYIQFVDADDYIPLDSTKNLVRAARDNRADLVVGAFYRVVKDTLSIKSDIEESGVLTQKEYSSYMMAKPADFYYGVLWNKLYKRSLIQQHNLHMDEQLHWCEDTVFNLEYVLRCRRIAVTQLPVYYYLKNEGSLVASSTTDFAEVMKIKREVAEYYDAFYQNLYDVNETAGERLNHLHFMFSFATDDSVRGRGRTRVGRERQAEAVNTSLENNMATMLYYMDAVYGQYLRAAAADSGLSLDDLKVLNCLMFHEAPMALAEVADYADLGTTACIASVEKLALKKMVRVDYLSKNMPVQVEKGAEPVLKKLRYALGDFENACLKGFSNEERQKTRKTVARVNNNLKEMLRQVQTEPEEKKKPDRNAVKEKKKKEKKNGKEKKVKAKEAQKKTVSKNKEKKG